MLPETLTVQPKDGVGQVIAGGMIDGVTGAEVEGKLFGIIVRRRRGDRFVGVIGVAQAGMRAESDVHIVGVELAGCFLPLIDS